MKIVKFIVLYFCLIGSSFAFSQAKYEDVCAKYDSIKKNIERYDTIIAKEEKSSKKEEIKILEECKKIRNDLVEQIKKLEQECSTAKVAKGLQDIVTENEKIKPDMLNDSKKLIIEHKQVDYDKYFKKINEYETSIKLQEDTIKIKRVQQKGVLTKLKDNIARITRYDMVDEIPGAVMQETSEEFVKKCSIIMKVELTYAEKMKVQETFDAAKKKYLALEKEKQAAEKELNKLKSAVEELHKQFEGCKDCPN